MTSPADALLPERSGSSALRPFVEPSALEHLPRRQLSWVTGSAVMGAVIGLLPVWWLAPELGLAVALGAGASLTEWRRLWAAPFVIAAVVLAGLAFSAIGLPPILAAGAVAGGLAAYLSPQRTDALDVVHGALGTLIGATVGLWVAVTLLPSGLPVAVTAAATSALVALVGSQGLLPVALRFDTAPQVPSAREVQRALRNAYRPPVFRALDLYAASQAQAPDRDTRRGLGEVATWVYRLQSTLQTLDTELAQIDPEQVQARIDSNRATGEMDEFTRERRAATAQHLERLLQHRAAIRTERGRTEADVDYALAFLEEARAGLAVARQLPGESTPDRLPEVLRRLRQNAQEGDARRRTAREVESVAR